MFGFFSRLFGGTKKQDPAQRRKFVSAVAKLRKAGLIDPKIDARKQKNTRSMRATIKKYSDVIEGSAQTVKIKGTKKEIAAIKKEYGEFQSARDRIVVPVSPKRGRVTYSKKGGLGANVQRTGQKYRSQIVPRAERTKAYFLSQNGKGYTFRIVFGTHAGARAHYFDDFRDLEALMNEYDPRVRPSTKKHPRNFDSWENYVEILKPIGKARISDVEGEDDE